MTTQDIFIIIISSLVGIIYLYKIRSYDLYEKEPFIKLLLVTVFGGVISITTSVIIYKFVEVKSNFTDAIFKIGLIEESSKLLTLVILYSLIIKKDFNEIVDGIIYISAISLGFSIIENINYSFKSQDPFFLLFQRSVYSVLGHLSFSGYMGIAFYIHKRVRKNVAGILLSLLLACLAHGFYDGILFHPVVNPLFNFVFFGLLFLQFYLLKTALSFSNYRKLLSESVFTETNEAAYLNCCKCDLSFKSQEFRFEEIRAGYCASCKNLILDLENLRRLYKYFRPLINFNKFVKQLPRKQRIIALDMDMKILYNTKRDFLSADINDLGIWLEENNKNDRTKVLELPIIGFIQKHLGLKYLTDSYTLNDPLQGDPGEKDKLSVNLEVSDLGNSTNL